MLVLPVLTLALIELGYVLRITRASMVEVMRSPYIRTAFLKGLPYWRIVFKHAIEAGAMVLVIIAVGTQLLADIIYTFLNPRIRYT
jgi:peptide/nickel transport system permease protein